MMTLVVEGQVSKTLRTQFILNLIIKDLSNFEYKIKMNITRLNFKQVLPLIKEKIKQSNFVALDLEMSGIISTPQMNPSLTDTLQQRYEKTKYGIKQYVPLQLGLCCIQLNQQQNKVVYSPFNIYVYPMSVSENNPQQFVFNSSSMQFLASNKFDFNKLFYEGIPYINMKKYAVFKQESKVKKIKKQYFATALQNSPDVQAFFQLNIQQFRKWIGSEEQTEFQINIEHIRIKVYEKFIETIRAEFPSLDIKVSYSNFNKQPITNSDIFQRNYLIITKNTKPETQTQQNSTQEKQAQDYQKLSLQEEQQIDNFLLNGLINIIISEKKPLIVHNGYLDLMHVYNRFIGHLPQTQRQYKALICSTFPTIYDTKFICGTNPVILNKLAKATHLNNCYTKLRSLQIESQQSQSQSQSESKQQRQKSEIDRTFKQYNFDGINAHQAGFDALMTGYTFVNAMKLIGKNIQNLYSERFVTESAFHKNKVPLGSIQIPYNFQENHDLYSTFSKTKIHFKCLTDGQNINIDELKDHFSIRYGSVHFIWKQRGTFNFTLLIVDNQKFLNFIEKHDESGFGIYKYDDDRFLIEIQGINNKRKENIEQM